jgi:hypothetical protein
MRAHYAHDKSFGAKTTNDWFDIAQPGYTIDEDPEDIVGYTFINYYDYDTGETTNAALRVVTEAMQLQIPKTLVPHVTFKDPDLPPTSFETFK